MTPGWNKYGYLPPGIYHSNWQEFEKRFSWNPKRSELLIGLKLLLFELERVNCGAVYIEVVL